MSKAKNNGTAFESHIKLAAEGYAAQGRATLEKADPPTAIRYKGPGKPFVQQLENPFLDFLGVWTERGGRALFIEAKSTEEHRLPICRDNGLTSKQVAALQRWHDAGAVVGVVWHHRGEWRLVTLSLIEMVRAEGSASLRWADAMTLPRGTGLIQYDFLTALACIYGQPLDLPHPIPHP